MTRGNTPQVASVGRLADAAARLLRAASVRRPRSIVRYCRDYWDRGPGHSIADGSPQLR